MIVLNLLFASGSGHYCARASATEAVLGVLSVAWVVWNGPLEGATLFTISSRHGVTESDLLARAGANPEGHGRASRCAGPLSQTAQTAGKASPVIVTPGSRRSPRRGMIRNTSDLQPRGVNAGSLIHGPDRMNPAPIPGAGFTRSER
ncbi:hypothetical protein GORHZ_083_00165 [Gordonia rhizosphera NBRC 16068]|uniref:Uncharacterized protein n=1 Tax=Gordonia rhizosphera NBRC 16068 TaxID=1108045 RepID=K6V263_9ACTN|nr:hypothetical protein GORHZ_083_00165 [Gordonia rhizosphera NBRC 16068]